MQSRTANQVINAQDLARKRGSLGLGWGLGVYGEKLVVTRSLLVVKRTKLGVLYVLLVVTQVFSPTGQVRHPNLAIRRSPGLQIN